MLTGIFFCVRKTVAVSNRSKNRTKVFATFVNTRNVARRQKVVDVFEKTKPYILPLILLVFIGLMLAFPTHYLTATRNGLSLFAHSILPAIFPFLFLSSVLGKTDFIKDVSRAFEKPIKFLFGTSSYGAYVLFSSLICGYPVGALTTYELYKDGRISSRDARSFLPFTSTAGPIFILATVGGAIFGDKDIGLVILLSHYAGTLINGLLWRRRSIRLLTDNVEPCTLTHAYGRVHALIDNDGRDIFGDSIVKSTTQMLTVGGYIVLFGLLIDTLCLLPFVENLSPILKSLLFSLFEMTRGVATCTNIPFKWLSVSFATLAVTFGGLGVNMQNYHFLSKCKCPLKEVVLSKISQGILAFFCAIIFSLIFFNIFGTNY